MTAHGEALRAESQDDQLVDGVKQDYTRLNLSPGERAMLDYAVKLTVAPSSVGEEDIQTLRAQGFDDRDILDIVYVICLYNFNDRMADAMGIKGHDFLHG
ncbi:MAG TPA: peroxidase-related enzyme [Candidatus Binatia bacterium]